MSEEHTFEDLIETMFGDKIIIVFSDTDQEEDA